MGSAILFVLGTFVLTGIPTGYWTAKVLKGIDIREYGSGSTGATNVWRCVGKVAGTFVFIVDVLKGYAPAAIANWLSQGYLAHDWAFAPNVVPAIVAVAALIGHSKSVFLNFSGGKSAATGLGTLFGLCPMGGFLTFITWITLVFATKLVSLSSILGVFMCPIYFWFNGAPLPYVLYCVFGFIYVTYRHKANVKRLLNGTEPKITDKPKEMNDKGKDEKKDEKSTEQPSERSS